MKLISPTNKGIRIRDGWGSGLFGAPRGSSVHYGLDFLCEPGQSVVAPITPDAFGPSKPYKNSPEYGGIYFANRLYLIELWYVDLFDWVSDPQAVINQGWEIGIAQDIREKISRTTGKPFGDKMKPHLHMQIRLRVENLLPGMLDTIIPGIFIDPLVLM